MILGVFAYCFEISRLYILIKYNLIDYLLNKKHKRKYVPVSFNGPMKKSALFLSSVTQVKLKPKINIGMLIK